MSYIFSDKTISVNLDKFENGETNKLLIIGLLGSGKTTLTAYLAQKYNVNMILHDTSHDRMLRGLHNNDIRMIIDGTQITTLYKYNPDYRKLILKQSMIIIGLSAIEAGLRADKRDGMLFSTVKNWSDAYYFVRTNIFNFHSAFNLMKKDVMKIKDADIKEYTIPEFEPVYY